MGAGDSSNSSNSSNSNNSSYYDYRIIFVERELDEILASQRAMLDRSQASGEQPDDDALKRAYQNQLSEIKSWLSRQTNMRTVFIPHGLALQSPESVATTVFDFMSATGGFPAKSCRLASRDSRIDAMAGIVYARLHRQRCAGMD